MPSEVKLDLGHFHPKQSLAFTSPATEILYGGAFAAGKSVLMRFAAILWCLEIPGLNIYLFRKHHLELVKNHLETPQGFRAKLKPWVDAKFCTIVRDEVRFANGSRIFLCHLNLESDIEKVMGAEFHVLMVDEAQQFTDISYRKLRSRVRMTGITVPDKYKGMFPRIILGATPHGVGHMWLKEGFVDPADGTKIWKAPASEGGFQRQFIRAVASDNPTFVKENPNYQESLQGLGSPELVKAWLEGSWDIISGAFFPEFSREKHVIEPFPLESYWTRLMAVDQGYHDPWAGLWGAVTSEPYWHGDKLIPAGSIVVYRERQGTRKTVRDISEAIHLAEAGETIADRVLSPDAFPHGSGPSLHEGYAKEQLYFRKADNKRTASFGRAGGFNEIRTRLQGIEGDPTVFIFNTCKNLIKMLPAMQHNEIHPEEMMRMTGEDVVDAFRYLLMARPWITPRPKPPEPVLENPTVQQLLDQYRRHSGVRQERI